jgi:glutathione S-transferase
VLAATFRGPSEVVARLEATLSRQPWLLGDQPSAADLLLSSPYLFMPDATPDVPAIRDWVRRNADRPSVAFANEYDARMATASYATSDG